MEIHISLRATLPRKIPTPTSFISPERSDRRGTQPSVQPIADAEPAFHTSQKVHLRDGAVAGPDVKAALHHLCTALRYCSVVPPQQQQQPVDPGAVCGPLFFSLLRRAVAGPDDWVLSNHRMREEDWLVDVVVVVAGWVLGAAG